MLVRGHDRGGGGPSDTSLGVVPGPEEDPRCLLLDGGVPRGKVKVDSGSEGLEPALTSESVQLPREGSGGARGVGVRGGWGCKAGACPRPPTPRTFGHQDVVQGRAVGGVVT